MPITDVSPDMSVKTRRYALGLAVVVLLLNLFVFGLVADSLVTSHRQSMETARVTTRNLTRVLERNITGIFDKIDAVLFAAQIGLERRIRMEGLAPAEVSSYLHRHFTNLPETLALRATDAQGNILYGTRMDKAASVNIAARQYFRTLRDDPATDWVVSEPLDGVINHKRIIVIARRLNAPDGRFAGIVYAPIDLQEFSRIFLSLDVGRQGSVFIRRTDGDYSLIARQPDIVGGRSVLGRIDPAPPLLAFLNSEEHSGEFEIVSTHDQAVRRLAVSRMPKYRLLVGVGLSVDEFTAGWRKQAFKEGGLAMLFLVLSVLAAAAIYRNEKRRLESMAVLAAQEEKFRTIADYTYNWESWVDADGKLLWISPAVESVTGYTAEECLAMTDYPLRLVHPDDVVPFNQLRANLVSMGGVRDGIGHMEFRFVRKDGELRQCERSWRNLFDADGQFIGQRSVIRDITEQKEAERRLLAAKGEAEQASRWKSEFLANMSHEVRTPMNAIMGLSTLTLEQEASPQLRNHLSKIHAASRSLLALLNDILDYSKFEAGKLELEAVPFALATVLDNMTALFASNAENKGLSFKVEIAPDVPKYLSGDPLRLGQVLNNLVGNAVKFTDAGEVKVVVKLTALQPGFATLHFSVGDTGIGIAPERIEQIFEPFTQADGSITRRFSGTGLGLSICTRLVETMGGEMTVASEPGKGSTFRFVLPFALPETPPQPQVAGGGEVVGSLAVTDLAAGDPAQAKQLMVQIGSLLANGEFVPHELLFALKGALAGAPCAQQFAELERCIEDFDYVRASAVLAGWQTTGEAA